MKKTEKTSKKPAKTTKKPLTVAEKNVCGRPTKFEPYLHPKRVIELAKLGYTDVECCAEFDISESTFYLWIITFPAFSEAVTRARAHSKAFWLKKGRNGIFETQESRTNDRLWAMLSRSGYKMNADERAIFLPGFADAKTFEEKARFVIDAAANGEINAGEANKLLENIRSAIVIAEAGSLVDRIKALEEAHGIAAEQP